MEKTILKSTADTVFVLTLISVAVAVVDGVGLGEYAFQKFLK